jgi:hypothetical protein
MHDILLVRCAACEQVAVQLFANTRGHNYVICRKCGGVHVAETLLHMNEIARQRSRLDLGVDLRPH